MTNSSLAHLCLVPTIGHCHAPAKRHCRRLGAAVLTIAFLILAHPNIQQATYGEQPESKSREDFFQRAAKAIDSNEGPGGYTKICWNDAGAGISVGKLQWNQKRGDLPLFLRLCNQADKELFSQVFKEDTKNMLDEKFLRNTAQFTSGNRLGQAIKQALAQPAFQRVQDRLIRDKIEWSIKVAHEYGHRSELMVVEIADISNQMGCGGARAALKRAGAKQLATDKEAIAALCKQTQSRRANGAKRDAHLADNFSSTVLVP